MEEQLFFIYFNLKVDVVKLGYYGSCILSNMDFFFCIEVKYGIIFCGVNNCYGYFYSEVLEVLEENQIRIW